METSAGRGRLEFFAIVGAGTLLLVGIALGAWQRRTDFQPVTEFGRVAVFVGLAFLAYRGAGWARKVLALWIGFLSLAGVVGAINAGLGSGLGAFMGFGFAAAALYAAYLLLTSSAIDRFLARKPRDGESPPASETSRP